MYIYIEREEYFYTRTEENSNTRIYIYINSKITYIFTYNTGLTKLVNFERSRTFTNVRERSRA